MATEQASAVTTESESLVKWASWLAALVGLWVLASPYVLDGSIGSGTAMYSNVVAGFAILVLAAYGAYGRRTAAEQAGSSAGEYSGWLAAIAGLWIAISPFVLSGAIAANPVMWSNVAVGAVAFLLAGFAGYDLHRGP